jgi:hypothetical protein
MPGWCIVKENVYTEDGELTDYWSKRGVWNGKQDEQQRKDVEATRRPLPQIRIKDRFTHMEAEESACV